jgi:xylulokinase
MFLGLDLGTGSLKALLLDPEGKIRAEASRPYAVHAPHPAWAESDPQDWWQAAGEATRQVVGPYGTDVGAIGFSGQMHGVVLCKGDNPLRPAILWADGRSAAELKPFRQLSLPQRRRLANPPAVGMAGVSLLWLKGHEPEVYQNTEVALQPKDWLRFQLTGEAFAEPSDASATLLYDLQEDGWAWDVLESLGLRSDLLAPIVQSASVAGHLTAKAAEHLGLRPGITVVAGGGDAPCSLLGSGLLNPGEVQLTVGSGAQIMTVLDKPQIDPSLRTHLYRAVAPGRWFAMAAMQNAGLALEWVRGILSLSWEEAYQLVEDVPPGCEGLTFIPYLTGERTPHLDPSARGMWHGLGLNHTRAHLMRSALEGVAFSLREGMEALQGSLGITHESFSKPLRLAGGGTLNPFWRHLLSDVLNRELWASEVPSASAIGAALLAGIGAGAFKDAHRTLALAAKPLPIAEPKTDERLEVGYVRYKTLYRRVKELGQI